ncbi:hypothetical protein PF007_g32749 [Phytophthora fragariae]|uniref:Uncharacterized protein n=1 Tax=Phytophthora fragariae TaxID=53985 RepID=A0A6A3PD64_9STRA|nr:hypothetical protein PF007_g32749 [Phytophthora fragariae]
MHAVRTCVVPAKAYIVYGVPCNLYKVSLVMKVCSDYCVSINLCCGREDLTWVAVACGCDRQGS